MINDRITRKDISSYDNVIVIPYGELQNVLEYIDRDGYNTGKYGWNYDYRHISYYNSYTGNIWTFCVLTGYRVPKLNVLNYTVLSCEKCREYSRIFAEYLDTKNYTYREFEYVARKLLGKLCYYN